MNPNECKFFVADANSPMRERDRSRFEEYTPIVPLQNQVVDCIQILALAATVKINNRRPLALMS